MLKKIVIKILFHTEAHTMIALLKNSQREINGEKFTQYQHTLFLQPSLMSMYTVLAHRLALNRLGLDLIIISIESIKGIKRI